MISLTRKFDCMNNPVFRSLLSRVFFWRYLANMVLGVEYHYCLFSRQIPFEINPASFQSEFQSWFGSDQIPGFLNCFSAAKTPLKFIFITIYFVPTFIQFAHNNFMSTVCRFLRLIILLQSLQPWGIIQKEMYNMSFQPRKNWI